VGPFFDVYYLCPGQVHLFHENLQSFVEFSFLLAFESWEEVRDDFLDMVDEFNKVVIGEVIATLKDLFHVVHEEIAGAFVLQLVFDQLLTDPIVEDASVGDDLLELLEPFLLSVNPHLLHDQVVVLFLALIELFFVLESISTLQVLSLVAQLHGAVDHELLQLLHKLL